MLPEGPLGTQGKKTQPKWESPSRSPSALPYVGTGCMGHPEPLAVLHHLPNSIPEQDKGSLQTRRSLGVAVTKDMDPLDPWAGV